MSAIRVVFRLRVCQRTPRLTQCGAHQCRQALKFSSSTLQAKVDGFRKEVELHLPKDGNKVVFATAWLATDNAFVALMHEFFPEMLKGLNLVAIDTLHLFPETLVCAKLVQEKYGKAALWKLPKDVSTLDEFEAKYGTAEDMDSADFDFVSKVEPFQRALVECQKDILITGRRMDQAAQRIELAAWEEGKRTLNPMVGFSWSDILDCVDKYGVPINSGHNYAFRCTSPIEATKRHLPDLPWTKVDLGKPFWKATDAELKGSPPAPVTYVFKSFGDTHTTVPVEPHESERAGRFVRQAKTECGIHTRTTSAGGPHGGELKDLMVQDVSAAKALASAATRTILLNERQACDVFCLINGAFSPLTGFMTEEAYNSVVTTMRLPEKQLFGLPVTFDLDDVSGIQTGDKLLLRWAGEDVAVLEATSIWKPNKVVEAREVYGTSSLEHPSVHSMLAEQGSHYVGGKLHGLASPKFKYPVQAPAEVRKTLPEGKPVVAFQNRNPIHRAHFELLKCAQRDVADSILLVHPTCGPTQPGDIDGVVRIKTYEALKEETAQEYPMFRWAYLPYSMKMAGPREAIQHMIIRKNFGATHFIIGRDMAGTKSTITGDDFYGAYDAQEIGKKYSAELGVTVTHYENMVYVGPEVGYVEESVAKKQGQKIAKLSGTEFRRRLRGGEEIPEWFAFRSVVDILREAGDEAFC
jgi:sulfate adenylyltransferase